jgi:putative acetyltransferase
MKIETDDLSRPEIHALLEEHLQNMRLLSPPESVHALDLDKLRRPEITFWSAWDGPVLVGCGALKELDRTHGEIKSMRTPAALRRRGAGRALLDHIVAAARSRGYERLSLETGAMAAFRPAQQLYESAGFRRCGPFADYAEDPNSVFMSMRLRPEPLATRPAPLANDRCPLCGGDNACAPARTGSFETPCWCASASFDDALLARVPAEARGRACLCAACAAGAAP